MSDSSILNSLRSIVTEERMLVGEQLSLRYPHIWRMNEQLNAVALCQPISTEEISKILNICSELDTPVNIHGGLTNLVGATDTLKDEVVISLELMNEIEELDEKSRTITVQAGVKLEEVQKAAKEKGLFFPLNFGAKGSAQMGGIISTNAGGLRVFRYGMTRDQVLGIEAVVSDGTVISSMKKVIKDNSAYDLKHLFIGSEGTLGIVTRAVLRLREAPKSRNSAFIAFNDFEKVIDFLKFADSGLGGMLSGFEVIWDTCYQLMTSPPSRMKPPLPHGSKFYVLIESLGTDQNSDREVMQSLLEEAIDRKMIIDAAIAMTESDMKWFWTIREDVNVIIQKCTIDQHFDISIPISEIGNTVDKILDQLKKNSNVIDAYVFGHIADGNVHLVVDKDSDDPELTIAINKMVYGPLKALGGSVSAEHGIGIDKKDYLSWSRSEEEIQMMKKMKVFFDPSGILNRGRVFDI